jgi:hypothetical protein
VELCWLGAAYGWLGEGSRLAGGGSADPQERGGGGESLGHLRVLCVLVLFVYLYLYKFLLEFLWVLRRSSCALGWDDSVSTRSGGLRKRGGVVGSLVEARVNIGNSTY